MKSESGVIVYVCRNDAGMRHGVSERGHVLEGRKRIERFHYSQIIPISSWSDFCQIREKLIADKLALEKEAHRQREIAKEQERNRNPIRSAYYGSDAAFTRKTLKQLEQSGYEGQVAALLLRIQKASSRAKKYRGDARGYAYGRKGQSVETLCRLLGKWPLPWGWGWDKGSDFVPEHVIYIELPNGQVSFHSPDRFAGPDYANEWDGHSASEDRIIRFCEHLLRGEGSEILTEELRIL